MTREIIGQDYEFGFPATIKHNSKRTIRAVFLVPRNPRDSGGPRTNLWSFGAYAWEFGDVPQATVRAPANPAVKPYECAKSRRPATGFGTVRVAYPFG
jgi:hypothetical protein